MHREVIHLDPALEKRGFSGVKTFEDPELYITIGQTNEGGKPVIGQLHVRFKAMNVEVVGGQKWCDEWNKRFRRGDNGTGIHKMAFEMLMEGMTIDRLKGILESVRKESYRRGMNDLRAQFRDLLADD